MQFKLCSIPFTAISKVSGLRHPPTGGGPAPVLSQAESSIADHLQSHEVVTGITGGVDTDGKCILTGITAVQVLANEPKIGTHLSILMMCFATCKYCQFECLSFKFQKFDGIGTCS